ncbi:MAG: type II toxin-antitoxin system RelE/ParE family toxin [Nocardioidaceae bacterium]
MTTGPTSGPAGGPQKPVYQALLTGPAQRALAKLPPRVTVPLLAFIFGSLAEAPKTRGKPLRDELAGYWSARRGDCRIIYTIEDDKLLIHVIDVARRSDAYRPR